MDMMDPEENETRKRRHEGDESTSKKRRTDQDDGLLDVNNEAEYEDGECCSEDDDCYIYAENYSDNLQTDNHEQMYTSDFGNIPPAQGSLSDCGIYRDSNTKINALLDVLYSNNNVRSLLDSNNARNQLQSLIQKSLVEKQTVNISNNNPDVTLCRGLDQDARSSTSISSQSNHQCLEVESENSISIPTGTNTFVNLRWSIIPVPQVVIKKQSDPDNFVFKACGKSVEVHHWYQNKLDFHGDTNEGLINFTLTNVNFLDEGTYEATDHHEREFIGPTLKIETHVKEYDTAHIYWILQDIPPDGNVDVYRENGPVLFKAFGQKAYITDAYKGRIEFIGDTKMGLISFRLLNCSPGDQGQYKVSCGGQHYNGRHLCVQVPDIEKTEADTTQTGADNADVEQGTSTDKQTEKKGYDKHKIKEVHREAGLTVFMLWRIKPVSESVKVTVRKKMGPTVLVVNGKDAKVYPAYANRASFLGDTTEGVIKLTIEKLKLEDYGTYVAVCEDGQEVEGPKLVILTRLYVGNLPDNTKIAKVREFFESNGVSVTTVKNENDHFSAYTFVRCDAYNVDKALALNEVEFVPGMKIRIAVAKKPKKPENDEEENDDVKMNVYDRIREKFGRLRDGYDRIRDKYRLQDDEDIQEKERRDFDRIRDEFGRLRDGYDRIRDKYGYEDDADRRRGEHESRKDEYEKWRRQDDYDGRGDNYDDRRRTDRDDRRGDDRDRRHGDRDRYRDDDDRRRDDYDWRRGDYDRRRYEDDRKWEEYEREKKKKELVYLGNLPANTSTNAVKNFFKIKGYDVVPHFLEQKHPEENKKMSCLLKCEPDNIKRILEFDGELFYGSLPLEIRPPKDNEIRKNDTEIGELYKDMTPATDTKKFKLEALTDSNSVTLFVGNLGKHTRVSEVKTFFEEEDIKVEVLEEGHSIQNKHTHIRCHKRDIYKALALNGLSWHRLPVEIYKVDSLKSSAEALKAKSEKQNDNDNPSLSGETNQTKGDKSEVKRPKIIETTVIVGNLPNSYPTTYLNDLFDKKKIPIKVINRRTMSPNAYVDLERPSDLQTALKLNGEPVDWFNKIHKIKVKQKPSEDTDPSQGQSSQTETVGIIVGNLPVPYPLAYLKEFFQKRQINTVNIETKSKSPYAYVVLAYGEDLKNALLLNGESLKWENKDYNITVEKCDKPNLEEYLSQRIQSSPKKDTSINKMTGITTEPEKTIWVGNLSTKVYPSEVKKFFHDKGIPVSRVWKVDTERYALVDLVDPSQVQLALSLQGERLAKHRLKIRLGSDPKAKRSSRHHDYPETSSHGSGSHDYDSYHHHSHNSRKHDSYPYRY